MSDALCGLTDAYLVKTVEITTVNFEKVETVTGRTIRAVVQVAEKERLNPDKLNWSLEYLMIHSTSDLAIGEFLEYNGEDFKVVDKKNYQLYGFTEVVAEQTKRPLIEVSVPLQLLPDTMLYPTTEMSIYG